MNTRLAGLALLAAVPSAVLAQDGQVQLYGRLNTALENMRVHGAAGPNDGSVRRVSNYRSVLGFRGSEDLGGNLRVVYQIEGTLSLDTGAGGLAARDTRIGLEGRWGTLFGGNWTLPYNSATSSLDPFYPTTAGYMSIMGNGSASTADNVSDTTSFDRRQKNSVHYWTPTWNGLGLRIAHGVNEESPPNGAKPSVSSGALVYEQGPLYATLAHERHHEYRGPGLDDRGTKLGVAYRFGQLRVAAIGELLRYATPGGALERRAWYVSATRQFGPHAVRLGVAVARDGKGTTDEQIGFVRAGEDTGATHATLGYDYTLSKRSSLFVFYTHLDNERRGAVDFAINELGLQPGATASGLALGMRHAF